MDLRRKRAELRVASEAGFDRKGAGNGSLGTSGENLKTMPGRHAVFGDRWRARVSVRSIQAATFP